MPSRPRRLSSNPVRERIFRSLLTQARVRPVTARDLIRLGTSLFSRAELDCTNGMGTPAHDAKYLTYFGLGLPYYEDFFLDAQVTAPEVADVLALFEQRVSRRVTAQYITHEAFYCGLRFYVDENVLTPRSLMMDYYDTLLGEVAWENERILDLCTGSGCIGITLALKRPSAQVDLVDLSPKALKVTRVNVERFALGDRVKCIQSDLFSNVQGPYSLIISNPPYVAEDEYGRLAAEYKNEPRLALTAGQDGLGIVVPILQQAQRHLTPHGTLMVEVGYPAEKVLAGKYPALPLRWWRKAPGGPSGVFSLKNGYGVPAEAA